MAAWFRPMLALPVLGVLATAASAQSVLHQFDGELPYDKCYMMVETSSKPRFHIPRGSILSYLLVDVTITITILWPAVFG